MNPPPKKRLSATPEDWLRHARSDLTMAKLALDQDVLPEQICFHAEQAVEKSLKSVLLYHKADFPFTHDLEEILDTLDRAGIPVPQDLREVDALTPYAVESRYPGFWGEILESDVGEAIALAEKAIGWAERFICSR